MMVFHDHTCEPISLLAHFRIRVEVLTLVLRSTHSSQLRVGLFRFCLVRTRSLGSSGSDRLVPAPTEPSRGVSDPLYGLVDSNAGLCASGVCATDRGWYGSAPGDWSSCLRLYCVLKASATGNADDMARCL